MRMIERLDKCTKRYCENEIDFNEKQTSTILEKWVNNIVKFIDNTESVKEQSNMFKLSENEIMNVLC